VPPGGITNDALFEEYLLKDVIPTVEARYRVAPGRENRAIAGLSMGGGQSLKIGLGHLDLFSAVASFSGAVPADFETRFASLLKDANGTNERLKTLWIGCGRQDSLFVRSKDLSDLLTKYQVKHVFYPTDGVHNYTVWRKYLAAYAPLLFREGATSANAAAPEAQSSDGWKLVWSDEFDKDGRPDPAKWTYETGFVRNQELQWYQPENAWCEKGMLIIEGRRERKKNPGFQAGSANWKTNREYAEYTSASLTTKGIASWKYGRFEMRGRIDTRPGLWPAFWSLGVNGFWPSNGEIDIMEYYRGMLLANLIWAGQNRTTSFTKRKLINSFADPEWSSKFHVWRMDWDENRIVISVDGEVLNDSDLNQAANPDGKNGFRQAHSIILNLAIGGTAGGDPSATEFPARFEVDYVRVFQRE
jgi:beta-glucanase (GH16 family)